MTLFSASAPRPLADRLRPKTLGEVVGQDHLLTPSGPVGRMISSRRLASMILWGPPGCGKTFVARAVAGELGAKFLSVSVNDVLDMWIGNSERNMHEVFETARRQAPCAATGTDASDRFDPSGLPGRRAVEKSRAPRLGG